MAWAVHYRPARLLSALPALIILAACNNAHKAAAPQPATAPAAALPLTFNQNSSDAQASLTLPAPISAYPSLHARLYNEGKAALNAFLDQAHKDRADQSADGIDVPAYYQSITWKIASQTTRLLSLYAQEDDYNGGAHPNSGFQVLLWDTGKNDVVQMSKLFMPGADLKSVDAYVCHAIEAERAHRTGQPMTEAAAGFACPKFADSRLVLVPSTETGKIGAIDALYAPYEVGPYAEGPYDIRVPQALLKGLIRPDFADQFAGEPAATAILLPDTSASQ